MGISGISIWQLLIVLAIVVMLFGTKRLRTMGSDLGEAIKGFRSSISEPEQNTEDAKIDDHGKEGEVIDSTAEKIEDSK